MQMSPASFAQLGARIRRKGNLGGDDARSLSVLPTALSETRLPGRRAVGCVGGAALGERRTPGSRGGRAQEVIWSISQPLRSGVCAPKAREQLTCLLPPCLPFAELGKCFPTSNPRCPPRPTSPQSPTPLRRSAPQPFEVAPAASGSGSYRSPGTREGEAERQPGAGRTYARVGSRRSSRTLSG